MPRTEEAKAKAKATFARKRAALEEFQAKAVERHAKLQAEADELGLELPELRQAKTIGALCRVLQNEGVPQEHIATLIIAFSTPKG